MKFARPFPNDEFYDPELAIRRLGKDQALHIYETKVEPWYTIDSPNGHPKDWAWRRIFVYHRDKGTCQKCDKLHAPDRGWDLHHIIHRGNGGNHALSNLRLLCSWPCHIPGEHPNK
jgi:hypothetical protein